MTRLGLPSLAVTIGTLALYRGLALVVLGTEPVADFPPLHQLRRRRRSPAPRSPGTVAIFVVLALIFGVVLHATAAGRSLFAIGASEEAARFAGIRVKRIKLGLFVLSGLICALAGIVYTFRLRQRPAGQRHSASSCA